MLKMALMVAIYVGETASLALLSQSPAAYEGWGYFSPAPASEVAIALVILCSLSLLLTRRPKSVRDYFYWWGTATILVPAWVVAQWTDYFSTEIEARGLWYVTIGFTVTILASKWMPSSVPRPARLEPRSFSALVISTLVVVIGLLILFLGVPNLANLGLDFVYDRRAAFVSSAGGPAKYLTVWTAFILAPLAVIAGMRYRRRPMWLAGLAGSFLVYAWVGTKNSLLLALMSILVYLVHARRERGSTLYSFPILLAGLACVPALVALLTGSDQLLYVLARRALLVPSWDMMAHVGLGFRESGAQQGFEWLIAVTGQGADPSRYGSYVVGAVLRPDGNMNANSHFLSYPMQWGSVIPVIFVGLWAAIVLWLIDCAAQGGDPAMAIPFGAIITFNLSEFYLHTALVTGGILLGVVIMTLIPADDGTESRHAFAMSSGLSSPPGRGRK